MTREQGTRVRYVQGPDEHDHLGHPPVDLPKANREALAKIAWPGAVIG